MAGFLYTSLPLPQQLRVGAHPDITAEYAGFTPNKYSIEVFLRGIFRDVYMNSVTDLKAQVSQPWLKEFIEEDPDAFLGDAFRHIEAGEIFPEKYSEVEREGESLAPISGHHLNIITETDRTIEKWHIRISHNRIDYASYFKDYPTFKQFMEILKGNMMKGIKKSLGIIVKAVMCADPSETSFDDKDIARIFGRAWDWEHDMTERRETQERDGTTQIVVPTSDLAKKWMLMMRELINKYTSKARQMWKNFTFYNPYNFAFENRYEKMNRQLAFGMAHEEDGDSFKGKNPYYQAQNIYTETEGHPEEDDSGTKTCRLTELHRNDCLFALFDAISKAMNIITSEEAPDFWLGQDTVRYFKRNDVGAFRAIMAARTPATVVTPVHTLKTKQENAHEFITTASDGDSFEVTATADSLVLLLNPEDYMDLQVGIARRGQMDTRAVNLDMLRKYCNNIYPMRGMKPGFARLIDKRAFKVRSFFSMTDVVAPIEKITWRYKMFYQFAVTMFKNFAGTMFIPTPHFVASPRFYDKYGLIGDKVMREIPEN